MFDQNDGEKKLRKLFADQPLSDEMLDLFALFENEGLTPNEARVFFKAVNESTADWPSASDRPVDAPLSSRAAMRDGINAVEEYRRRQGN